jgi:hypothetical protein
MAKVETTGLVPEKAGETAAIASRRITTDIPLGWGSDPLSAFWDAAHGNIIANFAHASAEMQLVQRVDGLLQRIATNPVETKNFDSLRDRL